MAVDSNNFEIGEGFLTLQFEGEDNPIDVGGCIGAEFESKTKFLDVEVGQYIDPVDTFEISRTLSFGVTLKEDTLRNFVTAIGGDPAEIVPSSDKDIYEFPANSVNTSKFAELVYKVARVRDKTKYRQITLYKVKSVGGLKYSFNKEKEVQYKVMFTAYADSVHNGKPGKIERDNLD